MYEDRECIGWRKYLGKERGSFLKINIFFYEI